MIKRILATSLAGVSISMVAAGTASADVITSPATGFGGSVTAIGGEQSGILSVNAPIVDLRCATPWYGSAVLGGSTPIGSQNVVCDDVKAAVSLLSQGKNGILN
jgi:hypothetical protein